MRRTANPLAILALAFILVVGSAVAQDKPDSAQMAEMAAQAMELATPGPEHEIIAKLAGDWKLTTQMWTGPGAEPILLEADGTNEMILGGRFLSCTFKMTVPDDESGGSTLLGFDRRHEVFSLIGFDTWGTYYITAEGTYDEAAKRITFSGDDMDPVFGMTQVYDLVYHFISDTEFRVDLIFKNAEMTHGVDEFRMVESIYRRAE